MAARGVWALPYCVTMATTFCFPLVYRAQSIGGGSFEITKREIAMRHKCSYNSYQYPKNIII